MRKKKEIRHRSVLQKADQDTRHLCAAVDTRVSEVLNLHVRVREHPPMIPKNIQEDINLWRQMVVRFKKDDWRCTEDERQALRRVAQWSLDLNCDLRNQPRKVLEWSS